MTCSAANTPSKPEDSLERFGCFRAFEIDRVRHKGHFTPWSIPSLGLVLGVGLMWIHCTHCIYASQLPMPGDIDFMQSGSRQLLIP